MNTPTDHTTQRSLIRRHRDALATGADRARLAYLESAAFMERHEVPLNEKGQRLMAAWNERTRSFQAAVSEPDSE